MDRTTEAEVITMGERVVFDSTRAGPQKVVPLEYGHGSRVGDARRRVGAIGAAMFNPLRNGAAALREGLSEVIMPLLHLGIRALGGPRQVVFAIGLASILGGLADVLAQFSDGAGIFWMTLGGILVGLSIRFPWLR